MGILYFLTFKFKNLDLQVIWN